MDTNLADWDLRGGFVLGPWRVQPNQNLIDDGHNSVHLEPKVMEVLCFLAQRQDEVVSRNELIDQVWKGTYVTDEVLSRAISVLRGQLRDDRKNASFIVTVPKSGYRLIMPVTPHQPGAEQATATAAVGKKHTRLIRFAAVAVVLGVLATVVVNSTQSPAPAPESITDIAVLPFEDISEQAGNAFFSDGLTDEIIGSLSKVRGLQVVARSSSLSFRNRHEDVRAIGDFLQVHAVVEGTVKRAGNRIRISSQLSSTDDGYVLWSETYDRDLEDLLVMQEEISLAIVSALRSELALPVALPGPVNSSRPDMAAYQLYLQGRFLGKLRGEGPLRESIALYQQALALEPGFTRASLGLANDYITLPSYSDEDEEVMFTRSLALLSELDLADDAEVGEAEAIRGFIAFRRWQWQAAEAYFRKALVLAPNNANLYISYSQLLSATGRRDDAVKAAQQAWKLDAVSPVVNDLLAVAYLFAEDNARAAEQYVIGAESGFDNRRNAGYLVFLIRVGRFAEARQVIKYFYAGSGLDPRWLIDNIQAIATYTDDDDLLAAAETAVTAGDIIPRFQLGLWLFLKQPEKVYQTVRRFSNQKKYLDFAFLFTREGQEFRNSDEFARLVEETGLDAYWEHYQGPDVYR
jgi:TolB-like protein/DNA-binding winged helix-turn-helix (wHTH) protein/Flp pilus assembly protein TadD